MKVKKTEIGIITGLAVMLLILSPMLNPFITFGLGVTILILFLIIHFVRLKRNYPNTIETEREEQSEG